MRPIVTDRVALPVGLLVGLSVTIVSRAKMSEPIEIPFGYGLGWVQGTWGPDPHVKGQFSWGKRQPIIKYTLP